MNFNKRTPQTLFATGVTAGFIPSITASLIYFINESKSSFAFAFLAVLFLIPASGLLAVIYSIKRLKKLGLSNLRSFVVTTTALVLGVTALDITLKGYNRPLFSISLACVVLGLSFWGLGKPEK